MFWKTPSIKQLLPPPVKAAHGEYSMILSTHDEVSRPTPELIALSLQAIQAASQLDLSPIAKGRQHVPHYMGLWPGEHYKLLAGLVQVLQPRLIVEIGTATGLSALCMKRFLPPGGKVMTFDLVPWQQYPKTVLTQSDFADGSLVQYVEDLSQSATFERHASTIAGAALIFIDATHDGALEKQLLEQLERIAFSQQVYLVFDDIRVWTMLKMWREIRLPKLDLTSFGHWSGTGLVAKRLD